ncbi:MAG: TlyA family RNA methyltransferase [bacterium]
MEERIDSLIFKKGLVRSRSAGAELVRRAQVKVNGKIVKKPSEVFNENDNIEILSNLPFVGRGGEKLAYALEKFDMKVADKIAVDVGSSTGGFTDCLVQNGVAKVYAVDVGTDQLSKELRDNPKIISMENTDIRDAIIPEQIDIAVVDVSFISLSKIFPALKKMLKKDAEIVLLVKPQFEVGMKELNKRGIVKKAISRENIVRDVTREAEKVGFSVKKNIESPITGKEGNVEYLLYAINKI